jgi:hypothetical protein
MKKWNVLKKIIFWVACSGISFLIFNYFISKIDISNYISNRLENIDVIDKIEKYINKIISFIAANIVSFIGTFINMKKYNSKAMPILHLRVLNTTAIRRSQLHLNYPEIIIGEGDYYIYVTMNMQNSGEGIIENCNINGQILEMGQILTCNEVTFYIKICVPNRSKPKKKYDLVAEFNDTYERNYVKKFQLSVDANKQTSKLLAKKQRRR